MLAIFFPHLFEELEYLLPPASETEQPPAKALQTSIMHEISEYAVAGPSGQSSR